MSWDNIKNEVREINESVDAVNRIIREIIEESRVENYIPRSIEYGFLEELHKYVIDWMGENESDKLTQVLSVLEASVKSEKDLATPYVNSNSLQAFGAKLQTTIDIIRTYNYNDLNIKDAQIILLANKKSNRLRVLLWELMNRNKQEIFGFSDTLDLKNYMRLILQEKPSYSSNDIEELDAASRRMIERDIKELVEAKFVKIVSPNRRKKTYAISHRAYQYKNKLKELVADISLLQSSSLPITSRHLYHHKYFEKSATRVNYKITAKKNGQGNDTATTKITVQAKLARQIFA